MADELDDLLNDALSDFDKPLSEVVTDGKGSISTRKGDMITVTNPTEGASGGASLQEPKELFDKFFDEEMSQKLQREWESALKELNEDDPTLASKFQSLSKTLDTHTATAKTSSGAPSKQSDPAGGLASASGRSQSKPVDINKIVEETISGIEQSAEELQNMSSDEAQEKLLNEMKNMGLGGNMSDMMGEMGDLGGMEGNFMAMMEGMMGNLLSKDVLYPTMKEISKAYPQWLEENDGEFPEEEFQRYQKQSQIIEKICKAFEEESENDTKEVKSRRLNDLMNLVEKMQEYGNPPKELLEKCGADGSVDVGKLFGGPPGLDPSSFNPADINPDSCIVM